MAPRFEDALDIPKGGVLLALPALLVSGLPAGELVSAFQTRKLLAGQGDLTGSGGLVSEHPALA